MTIFDLTKSSLLSLKETQLEELIARLAEAELQSKGLSTSYVRWSGSVNSPDGGVDIRVDVPSEKFSTGYLERSNTIFQVKTGHMPPNLVKQEMQPNGILRPTIAKQAETGGSYVIASLADDCSEPKKNDRIQAMRSAVESNPNKDKIHLDFFDRSRLFQWLRQHRAVILWVKGILGMDSLGWKPYGQWSNPPKDTDDTLILASGVSILMPTGKGHKLSIEEAIVPMRNLVRSTSKAIRITGLSGVGKTRIVQALFEEEIGDDALDKTTAVYADVGEDQDPSANEMLEKLIAENRPKVMVLDNCPSSLHRTLSKKISSSDSDVALITVEYDIQDDKPQTTEVVHIAAEGPDVAELLSLRRFPHIGEINARKIAEFAGGNASVALALAERVEVGESLAYLLDNELFKRLFEQRNQADENFQEHAEVLSLVYSFSVEPQEGGLDDLAVLGNIADIPRQQLNRSVTKLIKRGIAQQRSNWRAVLPPAIANRLAGAALENIHEETLRNTFEDPRQERLLMSFAHRLGLMHDHHAAKKIVNAWLQPNGLLGRTPDLNITGLSILNYIAPVDPNAVLERIEAEITSDYFDGIGLGLETRAIKLGLLQSFAYESKFFERCISLLMRVADFEDKSKNFQPVHDRIVNFFQPYLSGTHASCAKRLAIVRETLKSDDSARRSLGFAMLSAALSVPPWRGTFTGFGAHSRNFGFQPTDTGLVDWRSQFINLAVDIGQSDNRNLTGLARTVLAKRFRELWYDQEAIRGKLVEAARILHENQPWGEGWLMVHSIVNDYRKHESGLGTGNLPDDLLALEAELTPTDLVEEIKACVFVNKHDFLPPNTQFDGSRMKSEAIMQKIAEKAEKLGVTFVRSGQPISVLGPELFETKVMNNLEAFGRGLARGKSTDHEETWGELVKELHQFDAKKFNYSVLKGFIGEIDSRDRQKAQVILDQCLISSQLQQVIVKLHPSNSFDEGDFNRCIDVLNSPEVDVEMFGCLIWVDTYDTIPQQRLIDLAKCLVEKPQGDSTVLTALSMKIARAEQEADISEDLLRVGLKAATCRFKSQIVPEGEVGYHMNRVVTKALSSRDIGSEKSLWLDAIFSVVDKGHGRITNFFDAIRTTVTQVPEDFLKRAFLGDKKVQCKRWLFLKNISIREPFLGDVDVDRLITWCRSEKDPDIWPVIAANIRLWVTDESDGAVRLSEEAMKFLEAAPCAKVITRTYLNKVAPSLWWGRRVDIVRKRAAALEALRYHPNKAIASAAKLLEVSEYVKKVELSDRFEAKREQRFE